MKYHSTVLFVNEIAKSKAFYSDIIGLEVEHDFGANIIFHGGLSIWQIQPEHSIKKNLNTSGGNTRFELYFESSSIARVEKMLQENSVSFFHGIHEEPWGQQTIRFFDPDNNLIEVGEPLPVFVKNMYDGGLTPEQIHAKSGIALAVIQEIIK